MIERGAYALAETRRRRATWLNAFEPAFKVHLAWCLCKQGRYAEAHDWAAQVQAQKDESHVREILKLAARRIDIFQWSQQKERIAWMPRRMGQRRLPANGSAGISSGSG